MKILLLFLCLLSTAAYGQYADNVVGDVNRPIKAAYFKSIQLEGLAPRIAMANPDGSVKFLPNGLDGQILQIVGGVPTWVDAGDFSGTPPTVTQIHTSGNIATLAPGVNWFIVNPATTLSTLSVTLPPDPKNGDEVLINFGGTMTEGEVVSSFSVSPTPVQSSVPETLMVGDGIKYKWMGAPINKWYRQL